MKKWMYLLLGLVGILCLWGCKEAAPEAEGQPHKASADMRNVEERDYGTILIVDEGKEYEYTLGIAKERQKGEKSANEKVCRWQCRDLTELAQRYQEEMGKDLSLAHLKVIFLVPKQAVYSENEDLLKMLEQDVEIAKTVPMLLLRDSGDFLEYLEDEKKPVGTYIENLIRVKDREHEAVSRVADYLKAWREGEEVTPDYLVKSEEGFRIENR